MRPLTWRRPSPSACTLASRCGNLHSACSAPQLWCPWGPLGLVPHPRGQPRTGGELARQVWLLAAWGSELPSWALPGSPVPRAVGVGEHVWESRLGRVLPRAPFPSLPFLPCLFACSGLVFCVSVTVVDKAISSGYSVITKAAVQAVGGPLRKRQRSSPVCTGLQIGLENALPADRGCPLGTLSHVQPLSEPRGGGGRPPLVRSKQKGVLDD